MLIVLDTNVLISAMLKRTSKPAQILDAVLERKIELAIDERILEEYSAVIQRPRLNIPAEKADAILRFISFSAVWVKTQPLQFNPQLVQDPGDLPFAEVAICSGAEAIVTGNLKHFEFLHELRIEVLLPDAFLKKYLYLSR